MPTSQVLQHVIDAITPSSQASAEAARAKLRGAGAPVLENLAAALAAAQHTTRPRAAQRILVVAAGDHGCGDPGIAMGADHPTVVAARAIADGSAALCQVARPTPIILVDAGAREPKHMPPIAIALGRGPSRDLLREPAQTIVDALLGLEAGIALSLSLSEPAGTWSPGTGAWSGTGASSGTGALSGTGAAFPSGGTSPAAGTGASPPGGGTSPAAGTGASPPAGAWSPGSEGAVGPRLDVIALGALGVGAEVASAAILGAIRGGPIPLPERDDAAELAMLRGAELRGASGLELLAHFGGSETAVLAGLMLGAASMNIAVILDGYATGAAALVAASLAPDISGYLIAAHAGTFTMPGILAHLGLRPVFEVGLGHGEGTGAAMVLPLLDQVAAIAARG